MSRIFKGFRQLENFYCCLTKNVELFLVTDVSEIEYHRKKNFYFFGHENAYRGCIARDPLMANFHSGHQGDKRVLPRGSHCVCFWMVVLDHFLFQLLSPSSTWSL